MTAPSPTAASPDREPPLPAFMRRFLTACAFATALAPIPATMFGVLPSYSTHARFLAGYTSFMCFLALGYVFYIRSNLAPAMFPAQFIRDPYQQDGPVRAAGRGIGRVLVNALPLILALASAFCLYRYSRVLSRSVEEYTYLARETALAADTAGSASAAAPGRPPRAGARDSAPAPAARAPASPPVVGPPERLGWQEHARSTAGLDDIPYFTLLSALYVGIFVSAEVAFALMAVKEHLRTIIGLTEADLVFGPPLDDPAVG